MNTSFLPRIGNKIPTEGVVETKFGANNERMDHPETASPRDLSHNHSPNVDTIAYASKILLKGP